MYKYRFEICLPNDQIKYFDYLANNYDLIKDKYSYDNNKDKNNSISVVSGIEKGWTYHTIENDRIIVTGGGNKFPDPYFACLQETLIKFNSNEEFQFVYQEFDDQLYQANIKKSSFSVINRSDLLEFI